MVLCSSKKGSGRKGSGDEDLTEEEIAERKRQEEEEEKELKALLSRLTALVPLAFCFYFPPFFSALVVIRHYSSSYTTLCRLKMNLLWRLGQGWRKDKHF